ncbi:MAG: transglycosylase SLT domain-containing protein, partial [Gammaproteobacteria bacterium]|nr:transglycosylase SLT domain-containing protein [Gammaproteobacteria bacterium]
PATAPPRRLWLAGRPQPAPCNAVFAAWRAAGRLTPALLWTRIERAIRAGHVGLAGYLARYLDPGDRHWVGLWRRVHEDPTRVLSAPAFEVDHPMGRRILTYGITRQARADAVQALALWEQLKGRQAFGEGTRRRVTREIALRLALQDAPAWEECLKALGVTATAGRWGPLRLRAALELGDWQAVIDLIHRLPPDRRERPRWRYWRARSLAALGEARHAEAVYAELAATRHYYGFLAADRLGVAYPLKTRRSDDDTEALAELARAPGIRRAHELLVLERLPEARREWHYATRDMSEAELLRAARLARRWGWHDRALVTLARTRHADELDVRFPTPFRETIERHTAAHEVDPAWVYAIIRQESSFMPDVRSPSGALGLMQLLPRTGRSVAERLGTRLAHRRELLDVETNLRLGIAYLARTLEMTRGHPVLATASYNAGYGTVRGWVPRDGTVAADRWIETLPLAETRNYVRNVLAYTTVYDHRLDGETTVLTDRMPPIGIRLIH